MISYLQKHSKGSMLIDAQLKLSDGNHRCSEICKIHLTKGPPFFRYALPNSAIPFIICMLGNRILFKRLNVLVYKIRKYLFNIYCALNS